MISRPYKPTRTVATVATTPEKQLNRLGTNEIGVARELATTWPHVATESEWGWSHLSSRLLMSCQTGI
jgi:hypothetical protein